ncbi:energy-coupling factor transporter transmembrane component T [Camelliibacillus cellulosilyticus]|uniref:Energy-coupling factor transporter transmembrane component T n=1 Tax=Camelliibacillus cellulosilyticus TaxID=2174486 RepID=A0ABV9GJD4_9BACL
MKMGLQSFHPFVSFFYYIVCMVSVMVSRHPFFLVTGLMLIILLNVLQDGGRGLARWWVGWAFIAIFFLLVTPLTNHRGTHILFYFQDNPIMLEAVMQGLIMALSLVCLMALFSSYNLVVTPDRFLFLFARILPQWALLTLLTMRFVPLLRRRIGEIELVQESKGMTIKSGPLKNRLRHGLLFVQILLTWSLEEAIQTADSMKARGYGLGKRSRYTPYRMRWRDYVALVYLGGLGSLTLFGVWLGDNVLTLNPVLEPIVLQSREWFYWAVFVCLIGFSIAIEGRELWKWRYWKRNN